MVTKRSRAERVVLWAQFLLVLADAVTLSQAGVTGSGAHAWVMFLPLVCVLPSAAAFRALREAIAAMLGTALLCFAAFLWVSWQEQAKLARAIGDATAFTWPLFLSVALLLLAWRIRLHRENEASRLHQHVFENRLELEESEVCGCIHCERIYSPTEIRNWIADSRGETAECPYCGIDAVVGSASGIPITPGVLARAHARSFLDAAMMEDFPSSSPARKP